MPSDPLISVIICTCNRAARLKSTLDTLGACSLPAGWRAEIVVVDNASTDHTADTVRSARWRNAPLQYCYEPRRGLSHARNTGLGRARGDLILFTDDDVLVAENWMAELAAPLAANRCQAVTGRITLAPELMRPWMRPMHKLWLASSHEAGPHEGTIELIGANMGFQRAVLSRVPAFDPELGAGALGAAEETLFGWQLSQAGYRIEYVPNARVVHQLDADRLQRAHWLNDARKRGRTQAYLAYHWKHADLRAARLEWLSYWMRLRARRLLAPPPPPQSEGCPMWEMSYVMHMEKCRQFCRERQRPRNYSPRGLVKRPPASEPTPLERAESCLTQTTGRS